MPPSALDLTPSVSHIHGRPLWSRPRRLRVHARRLPKHHKSSSQPTISHQHPRHGRLHRPRLRPRPPCHDWLRCRRSPGHANRSIINTMLTLQYFLTCNLVSCVPVPSPSSAGLSTPLADPQISGHRLGASPSVTHHPSSPLPPQSWSCPCSRPSQEPALPWPAQPGLVQHQTPRSARPARALPLARPKRTSRVSSFLHHGHTSQTS